MIWTLRRPDRAAHRVAAVGRGVHVALVHRRGEDRVVHALGQDDPAQRQIAAGDALGERDDVGLDVPMAQREPPPGAAKPGDDLVGDQQHLVAVADLAQPREIRFRRDDDPARPHHRLADDRGHRVGPFCQYRLLDRVGGAHPRLLIALPAIGVGRRDLDEPRHQRAEHLVVDRHAGRAHRRHRHAVIGVRARDDLHFVGLVLDLPVIARGLERRLVRFGPGGRVIHPRAVG